MTFEQLAREPQHLLLKCISGSQAYNLALPTSDTDIKGIFVLPRKELYGLHYTPQVVNTSNDEVFFELGRFLDLLREYTTYWQWVEEKMTEIEALYAKSTIPEAPDPRLANRLLVQMRESFYQ